MADGPEEGTSPVPPKLDLRKRPLVAARPPANAPSVGPAEPAPAPADASGVSEGQPPAEVRPVAAPANATPPQGAREPAAPAQPSAEAEEGPRPEPGPATAVSAPERRIQGPTDAESAPTLLRSSSRPEARPPAPTVAGRPAPAAAPGSAPASDRTLEHAWAAGKTPAPPGDGQARSSATIHIEIPPDLETQAPKTAAGAAPRKDSDRPTIVAQPRAASGAPTIRLRPKTAGVPPAAAGTTPAARPDAPRVQGDEAPDAGKEPSSDGLPTARTVRAVFPAPVGPATIKLAKPSGARIAAQVPTEAKKKTSRIPLESALDTRSAEPAAGPVPKTIRLKKPGEAGTLKAEPPAGAPASGPSDTSKLDLGAEGGGTPTQRKTIKVKRPTQRPDQSGGPETAIGAPQAPRFHPPPEEVPPDQPSAVFSVVAIAAILVLCVVIYLQMAQALGPDLSLTRLSYGAPGLDLAWPGKIPVGQ